MELEYKCRDPQCYELLEKIKRVLEDSGFNVKCNGRIKGVSGSYWDINCYFEADYRIMKVAGGIVLTQTIDPSIIEYIYTAKNDIGLDKVIVLTRSKGSSDLRDVAEKLGILIYTLEELQEELEAERPGLPTYYIKPVIQKDIVEEKIREGRIRGLKSIIPLISRKRELIGVRLLYYPLLCYKVIVHVHGREESTIVTREMEVCFEGGSGSLVSLESHGLAVISEWGQLGELEDDAIDVLTHIAEIGTVSISQLKEHFTDIDVDIVIDVLFEYGLIERVGGEIYTIAKPPLHNYKSPATALRELMVDENPVECSTRLDPLIDPGKLKRIVEAIGAVEGQTLVYYPIYIGVIRENGGESLTILIDGTTGDRLEDLEEVVKDSIAMKKIDIIIEEIEESISKCVSEPARPPHR